MKYILKIVLLSILPFTAAAQDTLVNITPENFKKFDSYALETANGWIFHIGNDSTWAKNDIDTKNWKELKPTDLSVKYADKNGRVEGWFRIKVKLDSTLGNKLFGIKLASWAASDLYINGKLVTSIGNTGRDGKPYKAANPNGLLSFPANLKTNELYTFAIHVVDHTSFISPFLLKSEIQGSNTYLLKITDPNYDIAYLDYLKGATIYDTLISSVCAILSLFFWVLFIQNSSEKNLKLIAFGTIFFTLTLISSFIQLNSKTISYATLEALAVLNPFSFALLLVFIILILVNIFKRKITKTLTFFIIIISFINAIVFILPTKAAIPINIISNVFILIICIYYIISSWKTLKGAQWAVVIGLGFLLLLYFVYSVITIILSISLDPLIFYILMGCTSLSFPLSLLVYVSMRFKEIITEVEQNAKRVVQLSDEKKEHALQQQKVLQEEVNKQTLEIRTTLTNLKSTQSQLIQSEKMASLGELTAGIAHEIQNPLNFVNNFSEVNKELLIELKDEIKKGNYEDVSSIADDVINNEEKINHHGKRADAIVKGMLQHSSSSSGQKEPTDINKLADEYLRLAYHGLRAKDKSFNATMITDYDDSVGMINVIPQDIGRVMLNLITNAFYASSAKASASADKFDPTIWVSTKKGGSKIFINVKDNGTGIPQKNLDKIFQPFFTTKPTGQGTGLGLSLSYDIVKAHGGELKVETRETEGTKFSIILPS
ncbi:MAG: ATP-binding protein [Bacteroidota bacterium]